MNPLSLYELNNLVRCTIEQSLSNEYWVQAELSDVRVNATGHCYLEFIQKDPRNNNLIAKARGTIWANVFRLLRPYFETETGQVFTSGIKVLVQVRVEFHELYGYSLTVTDIDPTYTLGDMAKKRKEILRQLDEEGVLTLNKELEMPVLPQRVAVISSPTAAGYGDFCNQLENNSYGFIFYPRLFPAIMQGERVEESIIEALNAINNTLEKWDAVVIIRGGGSVSDLAGFDSYLLAANCAQFPLPIITGIGHERDDTVIDMIAHTRVKTPTAAAEYLINRVHESALRLDDMADYILSFVAQSISEEKQRLARLTERLPEVFALRRLREEHKLSLLQQRMRVALSGIFPSEYNKIESLWQRIGAYVNTNMLNEQHRLQLLEQRAGAMDIDVLLKRGFSITLKNGCAVTDAAQLHEGDRLLTKFANGETLSEVIKE